jgi:hypothetical protein
VWWAKSIILFLKIKSVDFLGKSKGLVGIWKLMNCCIQQSNKKISSALKKKVPILMRPLFSSHKNQRSTVKRWFHRSCPPARRVFPGYPQVIFTVRSDSFTF